MFRKKWYVILLLGILVLTGCGDKEIDAEDLNRMPTQATQQTGATKAPEENAVSETEPKEASSDAYVLSFEAETVEGEVWNSDKLEKSKLTMINVWATYCGPCLSEMPDLGELAGEYDDADFQIVGIISDVMEGDNGEMLREATELIKETKAQYPHLLLNESLYGNLLGPAAVEAVPTTFFVNEKREVLGYVVGANSKEVWKSLIDQLLGEME